MMQLMKFIIKQSFQTITFHLQHKFGLCKIYSHRTWQKVEVLIITTPKAKH